MQKAFFTFFENDDSGLEDDDDDEENVEDEGSRLRRRRDLPRLDFRFLSFLSFFFFFLSFLPLSASSEPSSSGGPRWPILVDERDPHFDSHRQHPTTEVCQEVHAHQERQSSPADNLGRVQHEQLYWFAIQSVPEFPPEIDFVSEDELFVAPSEVPNLAFKILSLKIC